MIEFSLILLVIGVSLVIWGFNLRFHEREMELESDFRERKSQLEAEFGSDTSMKVGAKPAKK